jgi:hypothetical protein
MSSGEYEADKSWIKIAELLVLSIFWWRFSLTEWFFDVQVAIEFDWDGNDLVGELVEGLKLRQIYYYSI